MKPEKIIFVIMPFESTPTRNKEQLKAFFEDQIKKPIEEGKFENEYIVHRSDETFNITEKIITDIYNADIVVCDLSGYQSNPNVMYELGMRLSLTNKPVILIREAHQENKQIFDISGFYAHPYDPLNYKNLLIHISDKLKKLETGQEKFESPVLKVLRPENPLLQKISTDRAHYLLLVMQNSIVTLSGMFAGLLRAHLISKKYKFPDEDFPANELYRKIQENFNEFKEIDFTDFNFEFSSLPTVDYYLANQYLTDIFGDVMITKFSIFVNSYHLTFLGTNFTYRQWTAIKIFSFFYETQIFKLLIDVLIKFLIKQDGDMDKMRSDIEKFKNEFEDIFQKRILIL